MAKMREVATRWPKKFEPVCSRCGKTFEQGCPGRHPQLVHLGQVAYNKQPGLFTGHYLAWHLSEEQFQEFSKDKAKLKAYCESKGFELEE